MNVLELKHYNFNNSLIVKSIMIQSNLYADIKIYQ